MHISYYDKMPQAKDSLYQAIVFRDNQKVSHSRAIYSFLDLLGDLGGVTEIILLVFGAILFPVSYHSYITKAINRLYFAKVADEGVMTYKNHDKIKKSFDPNDFKNAELSKNILNRLPNSP